MIVDLCVTEANGFAERRAALAMIDNSLVGAKRITLAADRGYDAREFVADLRSRNVTPHVAPTSRRRHATEHRTLKRRVIHPVEISRPRPTEPTADQATPYRRQPHAG